MDGDAQIEVDRDRLAALVCSFVRRLPIERQLVVRLNEAGRLVPVGAYAVTTVNALLKYLRGETAPSALAGDLAVDFAALPRHMQRRVEQVQLNLLMVNHDVLGQAYAEALAALLDVTEG